MARRAAPEPIRLRRPAAGVPSGKTVTERLQKAGLRVTRPRLAVFEVLAEGGHLDADEIRIRLRERGIPAAVASVYSALGVLQDVGLVRLGALVPGQPARYEVRVDNHHHLLCRNCGALVDVDCAVGEAPCLHPIEEQGYTVERANVTYVGLCPACRHASAAPRRQRATRIG